MRFDRIYINGTDGKTARLIRRCIKTALKSENVPFRVRVNVTVTDNEGIRELNREHRNIDAPTDVLSFPLLDWHDGRGAMPEKWEYDPESHCVELGDVVLSHERALAQAEQFGHSADRECGYLTVHSILHLLGYDHVDDEPRRRLMRQHEENIMKKAHLERVTTENEKSEK